MAGSAVPEGNVAEPAGRAKISQVFQFLRALNEHRNPATRAIKDQLWSFRLRSVPAHPSVSVATLVEPQGDEAESSDVILRVARPALTPAPAPPAGIRDWLQPSWTDAQKPLEYRQSRNETTPDGRGGVVSFEADPNRVRAREVWSKTRETWAQNELPALRAAKLFEQLYELHGRIEREAERVELVLGDGLLSWQHEEGSIFHPLLLQRVQLQFDPSIPQFTVTDTGSVPDLYTALLRGMGDIDGKVLARCRAELTEGGFLPLGGDDTNGFLRRLGNVLSAATVFAGEAPPSPSADPPEIGRDPILFLRTRNLGFANALEGILADLPGRLDLPISLLRIVGTDVAPPAKEGAEAPVELWSEPEGVLLSKPANPEQIQIAQRLDRHGCVLVQGPPGTGKTHTIANLIGHLLAQGKSVLVTSQTTKALKVLRDQIVPALRPLCVSVLENDLESRSQLEGAVTAIAGRLSSSNAERLDQEAAVLQKLRQALLQELHRTRTALLEAQSDEYRDIVCAGKNWPPSDAARRVAAEREQHSWVPSPVTLGTPCPLTQGEAIDIYASNAIVTAAQELELACPLPAPGEIISPQDAEESLARYRSLSSPDASHRADLWLNSAADGDEAELLSLADRCAKAVEVLDSSSKWKLEIVGAGTTGPDEVATWHALLEMVATVRKHAGAARELLLRHGPEVQVEGDSVELLRVAGEVRAHLESGGSLGTFALLTRGSWKKLLKGSRVVSGQPRTAEHLSAIEAHLQLAMLRVELRGRWDRQAAVHGAPQAADLGAAPEDGCAQFSAEISRCLNWAQDVWAPLQQELERHGLRWQALLDEQPPNLAPYGALLRLRGAVAGPLVTVLGARARALAKRNVEAHLSAAVRRLDKWGGASAQSPTVRELLRALRGADARAYSGAFARLVDLLGRRTVLERRRSLLAKVEAVAKTWATSVRDRRGVHAGNVPPGAVDSAWVWRQLHDELERRGRVDLSTLQLSIEAKSEEIRRTTADLIERRAWAGQVRRTALPQRQALEGWLQTIRKIGKGTGKRAPRLRAEAARRMSECKDAVPVWVMPLAQVVENFGATTRFDCVIVDEASQSDVLALTAMYMAKNVVVVGDHEQVSPSAVGQKLDIVQQLMDEHLQGIPNGILYDGQTSVYDLAKSSFGGMVCLTEHFRCVPEIIEFSNQLSYGGRIKPLRETGSTTLKPGLLLHRVEGHANDKVNTTEARALASLVAAAIEHPRYSGKTFGVISLVGEEQALEIERLLREHVCPADFERRRILCGNAAQFQGDERDVMFLSMVDSPQGGALALRADQRFKQRFNVAASRAKDQLWVVHSLNADTDLKPDDLRRRLIEHCKDPFGVSGAIRKAEPHLESPFEREVLERLVRAGYRVTPQWEVGHYRIDLVVEGGGQKLAVECDGDRYHPLEKLPEDMARQAILERLGWRFARIRGSAFFRDPDGAMAPVFERLKELRVVPESASGGLAAHETSALQEELVRRAAEIERSWLEASAAESANEDDEEPPHRGGFVPGRSGWARRDASATAAPATPSPNAGAAARSPVLASEPSKAVGAPQSNAPRVVAPSPGASAAPAERAVQASGAVGRAQVAAPAVATRLPVSTAYHPPTAAAVPRNLLAIGKSKEMVRNAIGKVLEPAALSCGACASRRRVWIGKDGPFLQCDNKECAKKEFVVVPLLTAALREIGATCDCGAPLKMARGIANATFIGCSNHPSHSRRLAWKDL